MKLGLGLDLGRSSNGPRWVIVGTLIEGAPIVGVPATPVIQDGVLYGPAGTYRVVNSTLSTDEELSLTPPVPLDSLGSPGDSLTIYYYVFSGQSPDVALPEDTGFLEDWSSYAVGNTFTELDAAYSRSAATVAGTIVTNADGPAGKALQFGVTSAAHQALTRDDISTAIAARTTERIQVRCLWKMGTTASARGGFGHRIAADSHTGILISRFSNINHEVYLQVAGNPSTFTNTTGLGTGYDDGQLVWTLMEIDGNNLKGKVWLDGASEPGSWTTRTEGSAISVSTMGMTLRTGNPSHELLGYRVAIGADAATF